MDAQERRRLEQRKESQQDRDCLNMMTGIKNKIESNIGGAIIHGVELQSPYKPNDDRQYRQSAQTVRFSKKPEMGELDTMLKSFKPGLEE